MRANNQKRDMKLKPYIAVCLTLLLALMLAPFTSQARYLNPPTGRFWTMDSYEGEKDEPLSLHKYTYCEDDPANNTDPEGHDVLTALVVVAVIAVVAEGCSRAPEASEKKIAQKALITGGGPANIAKRRKIDEIARGYNGSHLWDLNVNKDNFGIGVNKCNKFVYDVAKEAGAEPLVTVGGTRGNPRRTTRPPQAADYADTHTAIPNWRCLVAGENAQPGDIAAYKLTIGGTRFSGHCGFVVIGGYMSAHDSGVGGGGNFDSNPDTHYRRYTGN